MSEYKNTKDWRRKNGTTLVYDAEHNGERFEVELEMEPHSLMVQLDRLSVVDKTGWRFARKEDPKSTTGFHNGEYITGSGRFDRAQIHAFALGIESEIIDRLGVVIYPAAEDRLLATSTFNEIENILGEDERPDEGCLKDEMGRINFYQADEYLLRSELMARLWLSQERFDELVIKIKSGTNIRSARLDILADLYQSRAEGAFAGIHTTLDYGLLCREERSSLRGSTKARLNELSLEWSPPLRSADAEGGAEANTDDLGGITVSRNPEARSAAIAENVSAIRSKIDNFYLAAIIVIVFLVVDQAQGWIGF